VSIFEEFQARRAGPWCDIQGHMGFLYQEARNRRTLIELGVRTGNSTVALLASQYRLNVVDGYPYQEGDPAGSLWSVDVSPPEVPLHWHKLPHWFFRQGDDTSPEVRNWLPAKCDLLFIDTSHSYTHTMAELTLYVPRVIEGGIVLLHDTEWEYPNIQLDEPTGPVARALSDYCHAEGLYWSNRPGSYGMGVIRL
jgi:cephalosporin hydroxylase